MDRLAENLKRAASTPATVIEKHPGATVYQMPSAGTGCYWVGAENTDRPYAVAENKAGGRTLYFGGDLEQARAVALRAGQQ